ncbi:hypothetical protein ECEC1865_6121, partial [Escherichia coli EC1865]
MTIAH